MGGETVDKGIKEGTATSSPEGGVALEKELDERFSRVRHVAMMKELKEILLTHLSEKISRE